MRSLLTTGLFLASLPLVLLPGAAAAKGLHGELVGAPETVFDWSRDKCETWDVPDAPARAWRAADGTVRLLASHDRARLLSGPDLDRVQPDCRVVFQADRQDDPAALDDRGWLAAPWTADGVTVHALVHMEYHGHLRPSVCPAGKYLACWRNAVTYAVSTDGGRSFQQPEGQAHVVAALPYAYDGSLGRHTGYFNPSNIITRGSCRYVAVTAGALKAQARGTCILRNCDGDAPGHWRAWDGTDFTADLSGPARGAKPAGDVCHPLPTDTLPLGIGGMVRHKPSGRYLAVFAARLRAMGGGPRKAGIWAVSSTDLLHWSDPHLLLEAPVVHAPDCAVDHALGYPAILDPDATTRGFEDTDGEAYLYVTRTRVEGCKLSPQRDLLRLRLHITTIDP